MGVVTDPVIKMTFLNNNDTQSGSVTVTLNRPDTLEFVGAAGKCWNCLNENDIMKYFYCPSNDKCYRGFNSLCTVDFLENAR